MMKTYLFPAFRRNNMAIRLSELLAVIPDNQLIWSVIDFYGMGEAPNDLSMDEFERLVHAKPKGYIMPWIELKKFADGLDQAIECTILGAKSEHDILKVKSKNNNYIFCDIFLRLFDSTEWSIWARDSEIMKSLASVF